MNPNNTPNDGSGSSNSKVSWGTKAGYIGTGILIGLIVYPFVRKALSKIQPKMDEVFDNLTGKAENFAEKASDLMARAKENLSKSNGHSHPHAHGEVHTHKHDEDDHEHESHKSPGTIQ